MNEIVMKADKRAIYSITGASYFICCQIGWRFMPDSVDIVAFNFNKSLLTQLHHKFEMAWFNFLKFTQQQGFTSRKKIWSCEKIY